MRRLVTMVAEVVTALSGRAAGCRERSVAARRWQRDDLEDGGLIVFREDAR